MLLGACIRVKLPLQETWAASRPTNSPMKFTELKSTSDSQKRAAYDQQQAARNQKPAAYDRHPTKPAYFFFFELLVSGFLCLMAIFILSF